MYQDRINKVKNLLNELNLDACLISNVYNIIYLTSYSNFSINEREAFLLITQNKQYIITDSRYTEAVKKHVPHFDLIEISANIFLQKMFAKLINDHKLNNLGVEENDITVKEYKLIISRFGRTKLKDLSFKNLREIKENIEIEMIKKACMLTDQAFGYIMDKIKPAVTEKQIAYEIKNFFLKNGTDISFEPIVAFGQNSAIPHHKTSNQKLETKDLILLDFGAKVDDYCSDITRVVFMGKATNEQKKAYQTVLEAQQKTIEFINHQSLIINRKLKTSEVDKIAREYIINQGYPTIPHSLGHGVGLEVHESPRLSPVSNDILKSGMVFSIEPGIYLPNEFGIRIEDLVVLNKNKLKILTNSDKKIIEL